MNWNALLPMWLIGAPLLLGVADLLMTQRDIAQDRRRR
jgi:hypothetical protein